jgi:hypothetical protein
MVGLVSSQSSFIPRWKGFESGHSWFLVKLETCVPGWLCQVSLITEFPNYIYVLRPVVLARTRYFKSEYNVLRSQLTCTQTVSVSGAFSNCKTLWYDHHNVRRWNSFTFAKYWTRKSGHLDIHYLCFCFLYHCLKKLYLMPELMFYRIIDSRK